jgi:hypothetical protein
MRKIVFSRPDGGITVVHPVRNSNETTLLDAEIEQRSWDKLPLDAINPQFVNEEKIPKDRTFRDAWKHDLSVDMPKAVEIHKTKLRDLRAPKLVMLDVEFMRAVESGDAKKQKDIADKKQALRDVTDDPRIAAAKTPDELKSVMPDALK